MKNEEAIGILLTAGFPEHYTNREVKQALNMAIKALEQEPFINKPCVAHKACHEDKVKVLDKIRAEIEQEYEYLSATRDETLELGECLGLKMALKIIDKYKAESEENE